MAQIFDTVKTKTTLDFADYLTSILEPKYRIKVTRPSSPNDISKDKPLLIMCQNYGRIATDIISATQSIEVSGIPDSLVAVVIIHAKAIHSLPTQKSSDVVDDEHCQKYGLLVDFGYLDGNLHDCDMNTRGFNSLHHFLDKHISKVKSEWEVLPKRGTPARQGAIQFYSDPEIDEIKLNIPKIPEEIQEEIQVVRSVSNLRKENMWIVVCNADTFEEKQVRKGPSQNAKILVLIGDQCNPEIKSSQQSDTLEIKVKKDSVERFSLLDHRQNVIEFIQKFIDDDVKGIDFKKSTLVEAYTEVDMTTEDAFYKNLGIKPRVVQSVTDLTKLDPRILWFIVYSESSNLVNEFVEAPANAIVMLHLDNNETKTEIQFEQHNEFVLMGSLYKKSLPLKDCQKHKMKEEIRKLMIRVQNKLLKEPLEKFLEPTSE